MTGNGPRNTLRRAAVSTVTRSGAARLVVAAARVRRPTEFADDATVTTSARFLAADDVMIFAHHSRDGHVSAADRHLIGAFAQEGWSVGLSTTAQSPHDRVVEETDGLVDAVCSRRNVGYDFASWSRLIGHLPLQNGAGPTRLVLLNNSVYGPLRPIRTTLETVARSGWAVTGMTGSLEFLPHGSSYFMALDHRVLRHPDFLPWWRAIRLSRSKWGTILSHELRWYADFSAMAGGSAGMLFPASTSATVNPVTFGWEALVAEGMPFVKKSLFGANYDRVDMSDWRTSLRRVAPDFDQDLIGRELQTGSG